MSKKHHRRLAEEERTFTKCWVCGLRPAVDTWDVEGFVWFRARCPMADDGSHIDSAHSLEELRAMWASSNQASKDLLI